MELQAKDLRIGNSISYTNSAFGSGEGIVSAIQDKLIMVGDVAIYPTEAEPIPLTDEWLVKFGFGKDVDYDNTFINNVGMKNEVIFYDTVNSVFLIETDRDTIELNHIKHVHQLQNLYKALTGEELTMKEA